MIFDTLPWSNVVPTRSYFTNKWINEKFKNWSMNSRSSHILILWKFNIEVKPFYKSWTNHRKKLQSHGHVKSIWYRSILQILRSVVLEICAQWSWIRAAMKRSLAKLKWNTHHWSSHPSSRKVQNEVAWNLVIRGSLNVKLVRSDDVKKSVLTCHRVKCTLTFQMLEVEVTPLGHWKSSQGVMLQHEVAHASLFLQAEVVSYAGIQEVIIKDTIPEVHCASTNPVIEALRSQAHSNQNHWILKFQWKLNSFSFLSFSFRLFEVLLKFLQN